MGVPQISKSASPGVLTASALLGKAGTHTRACTPPPTLTYKSADEGMF